MTDFLNLEIENNKNIVEKSSFIYYGVDSLGSYIVNPTGPMSQDMIFPRKRVKFEDFEFWAPNNPDGYIKVQFPFQFFHCTIIRNKNETQILEIYVLIFL